jgi:hypothetical protein
VPRNTRLLFSALAAALAASLLAGPAGAQANGVPRGSAVVARFNPDNSIVGAVRTAASRTRFGPVRAAGFSPDCSPVNSQVVVCRDASVTRDAVVRPGPGTCVIATDPTFGGGSKAVRELTQALRTCRS